MPAHRVPGYGDLALVQAPGKLRDGGLDHVELVQDARHVGESGDKLYCTRHRADRPAKVPGDERDDLICKDAGQFGMAE